MDNLLSGLDLSPEELRVKAMQAKASNTLAEYVRAFAYSASSSTNTDAVQLRN